MEVRFQRFGSRVYEGEVHSFENVALLVADAEGVSFESENEVTFFFNNGSYETFSLERGEYLDEEEFFAELLKSEDFVRAYAHYLVVDGVSFMEYKSAKQSSRFFRLGA